MDTVIIIILLLLMTIISLVVYYYFFYALEGQDCIPEKDVDEFGIYKYDDNKKCVIVGCNTGYSLVDDKCVDTSTSTPTSVPSSKPYQPVYRATPKEPTFVERTPPKKADTIPNECDIINLVLGNHYEDGKLRKRIKFIIDGDINLSCSQDYMSKLFVKSSEVEPYLNSIGRRLKDDIVIEEFDYSGPPDEKFVLSENQYVRCGPRGGPGRTDNSCVAYGDEYLDVRNPLTHRYTSKSVEVKDIDACNSRCLEKKDCVAYSFHNPTKHCALAGVDYEGENFGGVYLLNKSTTADQGWTTKIKQIHGVPLHPL